MVLHGWKEVAKEELQLFNQRSRELSVMDGCILWGGREVPKPGHKLVLEELCQGHLARSSWGLKDEKSCSYDCVVARDQCRHGRSHEKGALIVSRTGKPLQLHQYTHGSGYHDPRPISTMQDPSKESSSWW